VGRKTECRPSIKNPAYFFLETGKGEGDWSKNIYLNQYKDKVTCWSIYHQSKLRPKMAVARTAKISNITFLFVGRKEGEREANPARSFSQPN
jgi:hypothetical protein